MCSVEGCDRPVNARGWCKRHYERWRIHGRLELKTYPTDVDRFLSSAVVDTKTGCWMWQGPFSHNGYGRLVLRWKAKTSVRVPAHHWSWQHHTGLKIPKGLQIDHLCDTPACVNPYHLRLTTPRENNARSNSPSAINAKRTHCVHGHEFTPENTYIATNQAHPRRQCKACRNTRSRSYAAKK